jgi:hypothetical protein
MLKTVSPSYFLPFSKLQFDLTFTLRNEYVDIKTLGANYVINRDGLIFETSRVNNGSATIKIVGGVSTFAHGKMPSPKEFYLSTSQQRTLSNIMRELALNSRVEISSGNSSRLDAILNGEYNNFRG